MLGANVPCSPAQSYANVNLLVDPTALSMSCLSKACVSAVHHGPYM